MSYYYFPTTCQGKMQFNTQNSNDVPGQAKYYNCSFCKRGFTNAQALGGHMNTHRRDRARLKQSYEENMLSLDISMKNTVDHDPVPMEEKNDHTDATERGKVIGTEELPHLPSFVGMLTAINEIRGESVDLNLELKLGHDLQKAPTLSTRKTDKKPFTFHDKDNDHGPQRGKKIEGKIADLDLELRLGTEPQEAPTLSTIEFF